MGKIYVVGIGPGDAAGMTARAKEVLAACEVIVGYKTYIDLVRPLFPDKEYVENGMRKELERCGICISQAESGRTVALICSGDAGIYGMASPLLEMAEKRNFHDVEIIAGVTAASAGAALLGAPLSHDFCVISLSDLLTPWDLIEKRLLAAADGDFCISLYNPASHARRDHLRRACQILLTRLPSDRCCGIVRNAGREDCSVRLCTLGELEDTTVDMLSTVFIGNSCTRFADGRMLTPRGYAV